MASYEEEYNSLFAHDTFTVIDADEYHMIRKQTGKQAIPSMGILTSNLMAMAIRTKLNHALLF